MPAGLADQRAEQVFRRCPVQILRVPLHAEHHMRAGQLHGLDHAVRRGGACNQSADLYAAYERIRILAYAVTQLDRLHL